MHKVQWISGMRLFRVPPGVGIRRSDPPMGDQGVSRDEGTVQTGGDASIQAEDKEWWVSELGLYGDKHELSEVVHTSYCKQNENKQSKSPP